MVTLVVYLKFVKMENGRTLTHSGKHTYREPDLTCCWLSEEIDKEQFAQAGWALLEETIVKINYSTG